MSAIRLLARGDEAALERFLLRHADSSLFLRSNARAAGLVYDGRPFQATYVAAWQRDQIAAVAAHCWNGNLLLQAPRHTAAVASAAVLASGRPVAGLVGPWPQVMDAQRALRLDGAVKTKSGHEELFALALRDLVIPDRLAAGRWTCRRSRASDLPLLTAWRVAYAREALGEPDRPELAATAREEMQRSHDQGTSWLLEDGGRAVAFSGFNARLPDMVQVGGVYTPPELRNRGYARAVVAGSLLDAREGGARRAVLFAELPAATAAYRALGFRVVGTYGLVLFRDAQRVLRDATFPPPGAS